MTAVKWYSRGYLPHFDAGDTPQFVTFRLADSLPSEKLREWREELRVLPPPIAASQERKRIEEWLDRGHGSAVLKDEKVARLVETALLFFDGKRYTMHAWVVMPNHVHALFTPQEGHLLRDIMHSVKSYTAHEALKITGGSGEFWQKENFDRFVRDEAHYCNAIRYVHDNPVKAGLCVSSADWRWSSASRG